MNVIARLEYELAYYDSAVHRFNYYTTRTPPLPCLRLIYSKNYFSLVKIFEGDSRFVLRISQEIINEENVIIVHDFMVVLTLACLVVP